MHNQSGLFIDQYHEQWYNADIAKHFDTITDIIAIASDDGNESDDSVLLGTLKAAMSDAALKETIRLQVTVMVICVKPFVDCTYILEAYMV